jgi:Dihydrofolate reductase
MERVNSAMQRRLRRLVAVSFVALFMGLPIGDLGQVASQGGATVKVDDWITVNKDYSSERYVDLDQISPKNVGDLKEVCEIQLNEPVYFNSGLLKVGRTLYVTTLRGTYAFDAATCLRWPSRLVITEVHSGVEGDVFFPAIDRELWRELAPEERAPAEGNDCPFAIVTYERQSAAAPPLDTGNQTAV